MSLYHHRWLPQGAPDANLILAHGYGEHAGRYAPLAEALNGIGVAVFACDHRGHGRSPGPRARIDRFDDLVDDFAAFAAPIIAGDPGLPTFLLGHSLGALVVGHALLRHTLSVRGLIFSSGVLEVGSDVSPMLQRLSKALNLLVPWLPVVPIRPERTSRIPEAVERYATDPLIHHRPMTARTGYQILRATREFQRQAHRLTLPILLLHGTADRITEPRGSRALYEGILATDKTLTLFEGAYHEMLFDRNAREFTDCIVDWVQSRCGAGKNSETSDTRP